MTNLAVKLLITAMLAFLPLLACSSPVGFNDGQPVRLLSGAAAAQGVSSKVESQETSPGDLAQDTSLDEHLLHEFNIRPVKIFRVWAKKPPKVVPFIFFVLVSSLLAWTVIPGALKEAEEQCISAFWKSLSFGILGVVLSVAFARGMFISEIGAPLGLLTLGVLELGPMLGLAIAADLIGEAITVRTGLSGNNWLFGRPMIRQILNTAIGVMLISLLLLIPQIGQLPSIGIRLVVLISFWGMGGLLCARQQRALH